ncbi:MAG: lipid A biosynthesis acyltransferase [Planctomycetaceae bacterium]|nr:lipid A biosynthesis acyltransferase [Planctomycetaceae bacterium]
MNYFGYLILRTFFCVIQALPQNILEGSARHLAWSMTYVFRIRRQVCVENLSHVYPNASPALVNYLILRMWRSLFLMLFEVAQAPRRINRHNWRNHVSISNTEMLLSGLLSRQPTMLLSGHYGNFELAGFIAGLFGFPSFTIARPLDNPQVNDYVNSFRSRYGQYILPKKGIAKTVEELLHQGETLTVLADQAAGKKGVWMDFMGRPASCHKALALYALTTKAEVVVVAARHNWQMFNLTLDCRDRLSTQELESRNQSIRHVTAWYNQQLEQAIRLSPAQYWWLHRRWKDTRKNKSLRVKDAN